MCKPASTLKDRILNYMKDERPKDWGPKYEGQKDEGLTENNKLVYYMTKVSVF